MTHRQLLAVIFIAFLPSLPVAANDAVADAQRSLAAQGFYFGKVDGRVSDETRAALKRFQIRTGLPVTGELDAASLDQLAKKAPAAGPPESPESLREIARTQEMSDREFLRQTEKAAQKGGNDVPAAPRSTAAQPAPAVRPPPPKEVASQRSARPNAAEVREYIENYLRAAEARTPDQETSFYADRVDYFDSGRVSREFVRTDQIRYYRRWPQRNFELIGEPVVEWEDDRRAAVRFKLRYDLSGDRKSARGMTENIVHLQLHDDGMKIVGIKERKLKN